MKFHCFFEQSGTFKNEFKKLGYEAIDYDIKDEFGETDRVIDLFVHIECAYEGKESIFDEISTEDTIIAFFPCVRFEAQAILHFKGEASQLRKWNYEKKLEYDLRLHRELSELYDIITKLAIVCLRKEIPLIIENPYSNGLHYLTRYWCIPVTIIDRDRRKRGDCFEKPTQYWFINCKPKQNMILEAYTVQETKFVHHTGDKLKRSLIAPEYANRFIREFILDAQKGENK